MKTQKKKYIVPTIKGDCFECQIDIWYNDKRLLM